MLGQPLLSNSFVIIDALVNRLFASALRIRVSNSSVDSKPDLEQIVRLQLPHLAMLLAEQNIRLIIDDASVKALALEGYEPEYGARPLRRVLRRKLEYPLATQLLEEQFTGVSAIRVKTSSEESESLVFFAEN